MKIVIGTSRPFHLVHLARELANQGNDVLVMGYMPAWKMKDYDLGKARYKSFFWHLLPLSVLALQRFCPSFQRKSTFFIMPFIDFLISINIPLCDVFIGLSGVAMRSIKVVKKKYNCITICDRGASHVEVQNTLLSTNGRTALPQQYIERELECYNLADYIVVPSIFSLNSFLDRGISKDKILINNYGVNLKRFEFSDNSERSYKDKRHIKALFVGGWSYQKGVDIILEAIDASMDLSVSHIGVSGGAKMTESTRMEYLGHISNVKLANYYKYHDVLLLPSRQDGFGMVLLEALACGTPVIASTNTGAPDVKKNIVRKDTVIIMDEATSGGLLRAIDRLKESNLLDDRTEILSEEDKVYFSWKSYGERYHSALQKIL